MSKTEVISCDNEDCNGGSHHFYKCNNGHDVCGCCIVILSTKKFCPMCIKGVEIK